MLLEIIGWVGTLVVVAAYLLLSMHKISSDSKGYQYMNLFGAIAIRVNSLTHKAYPSVATNIIWGAIAIYALFRTKPSP
ncbi:MAG TPA: hypothetical protein VKC54_02290 [Patescibacteria group bacterium]|nr:hypothetical protein [Patescibacteria group bacterium]